MQFAIIGVGNVGANLGIRLTAHGHEVAFGVRPGKDLGDLLDRCEGRGRAVSVGEAMSSAEVIFLAVPAHAAVDALQGLELVDRIVVDCNNPLTWSDGPIWSPPEEGSTTAQLARAYPSARFVKGFNTFGAEFHRDPRLGPGGIDVQLASDDEEAKAKVAEIARSAGFEPVDVGGLRNAAALENLAVLWIHLALQMGRGRDIGFKLLEREA